MDRDKYKYLIQLISSSERLALCQTSSNTNLFLRGTKSAILRILFLDRHSQVKSVNVC